MPRRRSLPGRQSAECKIHTGRITPCRYPHSRAKDFCSPRSSSQFSSLFLHPRNPLAAAAPRFRGRLAPDRLGTSEYDWQRFLAESDRGRHLLQSCAPCEGLAPRGAVVFQSIACASITLVLLWLTLYCKRSYLAPFTVAYTILSALIYLATMGDYAINSQAEEYCVLMLWGAYLREGCGLGSPLVYLTVVGCYFVSLARSRKAA